VVAQACHPSYTGKIGRKISVKPVEAKNVRPYQEKKKKKRLGAWLESQYCNTSKKGLLIMDHL
jgi:hypothetical protein